MPGPDNPDFTRSDMALVRTAITNGWKVPDEVRVKVLKRLIEYIDTETEAGMLAEPRVVIAAARTVVTADLKQQQLDLDREKVAKPPPDGDAKPRIIIPGSPYDPGRPPIDGGAAGAEPAP